MQEYLKIPKFHNYLKLKEKLNYDNSFMDMLADIKSVCNKAFIMPKSKYKEFISDLIEELKIMKYREDLLLQLNQYKSGRKELYDYATEHYGFFSDKKDDMTIFNTALNKIFLSEKYS